MADHPKHDVALSFFARDIGIARELAERLGESLSVFFSERTQDELPAVQQTPFFALPSSEHG